MTFEVWEEGGASEPRKYDVFDAEAAAISYAEDDHDGVAEGCYEPGLDLCEVGGDPDGLGNVEVRYIEPREGKPDLVVRLTMSPATARLVAAAMLKCTDEQEGRST